MRFTYERHEEYEYSDITDTETGEIFYGGEIAKDKLNELWEENKQLQTSITYYKSFIEENKNKTNDLCLYCKYYDAYSLNDKIVKENCIQLKKPINNVPCTCDFFNPRLRTKVLKLIKKI